MDDAKVDPDITYVAMAIHECCTRLFQMFMFLDVCCKCFTWMLHMVHTYVVMVLYGCCICLQWLSSVLQMF
jgi:hypothetical protein